MGREREGDMTRRRLLATAAAAGATVLGTASSAAASSGGGAIPRSRRALMAYTVRDLIANDPAAHPSLPAGYRQVFAAAATIGFGGIEFFSFAGPGRFAQHPDSEGGALVPAAQIKAWLDEHDLRAVGFYNAMPAGPGASVGLTLDSIDTALAVAETLQQPQTGSQDATAALRQKHELDPIIATWNQLARRARKAGIPIYTHCHADPWDFLLDAGPKDASGGFTRSSGIRVIEYFLQHTDPRWVKLELDIFWAYVAQHRFATYTAADGSTVKDVLDPAAMARRYASRCPIFHAKDGLRAPDTLNGWIFTPFGYGDIDLARFFTVSSAGRTKAYWSTEQDNAPGGRADPQKSLRDAASSYRGLATLGSRGGVGDPFAGHNVSTS
jgi:sugar phosphate isomerase/epimerase